MHRQFTARETELPAYPGGNFPISSEFAPYRLIGESVRVTLAGVQQRIS
jgi:hypothetical protein